MKQTMETLGKRISDYRKQKNMTQEQLAEAMEISPQAVSKWENDISCPEKIQITQKNKRTFMLLPTSLVGWLAGSRFLRKLLYRKLCGLPLHSLQKTTEEKEKVPRLKPEDILTEEAIRKLQKEFQGVLRKHRHLTLVDMKSADGDSVKISL